MSEQHAMGTYVWRRRTRTDKLLSKLGIRRTKGCQFNDGYKLVILGIIIGMFGLLTALVIEVKWNIARDRDMQSLRVDMMARQELLKKFTVQANQLTTARLGEQIVAVQAGVTDSLVSMQNQFEGVADMTENTHDQLRTAIRSLR